VLLYMMYKRVPNDVVILVACFIFNLNPLYVLVGFFLYKAMKTHPKPLQYARPPSIKRDKVSHVEDIVGADRSFDYVLLGGSIGTLYTAALLSRAGQKCCVLLPEEDSSTSVHPEGAPCAVTIENLSIGMFSISY
jgi:hypothetical protein